MNEKNTSTSGNFFSNSQEEFDIPMLISESGPRSSIERRRPNLLLQLISEQNKTRHSLASENQSKKPSPHPSPQFLSNNQKDSSCNKIKITHSPIEKHILTETAKKVRLDVNETPLLMKKGSSRKESEEQHNENLAKTTSGCKSALKKNKKFMAFKFSEDEREYLNNKLFKMYLINIYIAPRKPPERLYKLLLKEFEQNDNHGDNGDHGDFFNKEPNLKSVSDALLNLHIDTHDRRRRKKTMVGNFMSAHGKSQMFLEIGNLYDEKSKEMAEINTFPLELEEKFSLKSIKKEIDSFDIGFRFWRVKIKLFFIKRLINLIIYKIVANPFYPKLNLLIIVINSILFALMPEYVSENPSIEIFFVSFYSSELIMKIIAYGVYNKGYGYLSQNSNIVDAIILLLTLFSKFGETFMDIDFGPMRVLRLLHLLHIEELTNVIKAIFFSLRIVLETILIFSIFICFGALVGLQSFYGLLRRRCFQVETGMPHADDLLCGNKMCPDGYICGDLMENLDDGASSFDSFPSAFVQIFRVLNLNGWSNLMNNIQRTSTNYIWIFFLAIIFFGNFFLLNLLLAVLKVKYCEYGKNLTEKSVTKNENPFNNKRISFEIGIKNNLFTPHVSNDERKYSSKKNKIFKREHTFFKNLKNRVGNHDINLGIDDEDNLKSFVRKQTSIDIDIHNNYVSQKTEFNRKPTFRILKNERLNKLIIKWKKLLIKWSKEIRKYFSKSEIPIQQDCLVIRVRNELRFHMNSQYDVLPSRDYNLLDNRLNNIISRLKYQKRVFKYSLNNFISEYKEIKKVELEAEKPPAIKKNGKRFINNDTYNDDSQNNDNNVREINIPVLKPKNILNFNEPMDYESLYKRFFTSINKYSGLRWLTQYLNRLIYHNSKSFNIQNSDSFSPDKLNFNRSNSPKRSKVQHRSIVEGPKKGSIEGNPNSLVSKIEKNTAFGHISENLPSKKIEENNPSELYRLFKIDELNDESNQKEISNDKTEVEENKEQLNEYLTKIGLDYENRECVISENIWSGGDVLVCQLKSSSTLSIFKDLNTLQKNLWKPGVLGIIGYLRYLLIKLYNNRKFNQFHIILLTINTFFISEEDPLNENGSYNWFNNLIYSYFLLEITFKFIAFGFQDFFRKKMNIIDFVSIAYFYFRIVIAYIDPEFMSKYSSIRFLHTLSVLRFLRVLSLLSYMKVIHYIIKKTFTSFIYIAFILLIIVLMYSLFGLRLFSDKIDLTTEEGQQRNFQEFSSSFRSSFNIITVDVWYDIYVLSFNTVDKLKLVMFLFSLIFLGNYVMVNLFIAILLDGFEGIDEEKIKEEENPLIIDDLMDVELGFDTNIKQFQDSIINSIKNVRRKSKSLSAGSTSHTNNNEYSPHKQKNISSLITGCKYSLFIFSKKDIFRIFISKIVSSIWFENLVTFFVVASCIHLAIDSSEDYENKKNSSPFLFHVFVISGYCMDFFFILEALLKIIALGFILGDNTYLKTVFGIIDFLVLLGIYLNYVFKSEDVTFFKLTLILKMIRPLKLILKFKKMKIMLISMISSLHALFNVGVVLTFIWITFAIIGMTLFKDRFGYCESRINFGVGINDCLPPKIWKKHPYNFDTIQDSLITLLAVSTFDDWMSHLSIAANSNLAKYGPTELNNRWSSNFFFMSFIVIGVWFMLNLIVGVLFSNFLKAAQSLQNISLLTENQIKWIEMHREILNEQPSLIKYPRRGARKRIWDILKSKPFKRLTLFTLILNFFSNAFFTPESPEFQKEIYKYMEWYIDCFYILEGTIKIISFQFIGYFSQNKRKVEFISVSVSFFNSSIKLFSPNFFSNLSNGDLWLRFFYSFQIIPQIRLFMKIKSLKNLVHTISFSLPMILSVMALFILVMFVYSLIGIIMFKDVVAGDIVDEYVNFKNILYSFMTLFKSCTGDEWINIMVDTRKTPPNCVDKYDCGSAFSPIFFVSFMVLIRFIIFNLFILILVQNFENFYKNPLNPIPIFKDNIKKFKKGWNLYCEDNQNNKIHSNAIVDFLKFMGEPLGVEKTSNFLQFGRKIMLMEMKCDDENYIYFKGFLYSAMKGYFRDQGFFDNLTEEAENLLDAKENKFFQKMLIEKRKFSLILLLAGYTRNKNNFISKPAIHQVNPLYAYLNKLIIFKAWRNFTEKHITGIKSSDQYISSISSYESSSSMGENASISIKSE